MRSCISLAAAAIACGALLFPQAGWGQDKSHVREIRIAGLTSYYNLPWLLAAEEGFFKKRGINVTYKLLKSGSELILAISTNSADLGFTGSGPLGVTLGEKKVSGKIAAVVAKGGVQLFSNKPEIRTLRDIEGKVFAISGTGASTDIMSRIAFNMLTGKDTHSVTTLRPLRPAAQLSAMALKQIDVGVAWDMYVVQAMTKLNAHIVADTGKIWQDHYRTKESTILSAMLVRDELLTKDPRLVKDFIAALAEATRVVRDNPERVLELAKRTMGADEETVKLIEKHGLVIWHTSPTVSRDLANSQLRFMEWQKKFGYIKGDLPSVEEVWWPEILAN